MKHLIILIIVTLSVSLSYSQNKNTTLLGRKTFTNTTLHGNLNDVWGHVDSLGNEYAIVGLQKGVSIIDVTDPNNLNEVFYTPGISTIWRDIKTWDKHAYITNERSGGMKIIDMSALPGTITQSDVYSYSGSTYPFTQAHNLFIDENGVAYIFGSDYGIGGAIFLGLNGNPTAPVELGVFDTLYFHDGMVRGDTLWGSAIYQGSFAAVDVSTKSAPSVMKTHNTSGFFTHNCWISDNGKTLFTTDEISGGYVGAYDVSNFSNIQEVDVIQSNPGSGVIPHNTHVYGDFLVTSYYRDGVTIVDATYPDNLVQIGDYDSQPTLSGNGFNGDWGAYPWLPSGNLLITDIKNGLYVLGVDYKKGVYIDGFTRRFKDSLKISNTEIIALTISDTMNVNLNGYYKNAYPDSGFYRFAYSAQGYLPDTVDLVMNNGVLYTEDVYLRSEVPFTLNGKITGLSSGDSAYVYLDSKNKSYSVITDQQGNFQIDSVYEDFYEITEGNWTYEMKCDRRSIINGDSVNMFIDLGLEDDFTLDLSWTSINGGTNGFWERQHFDSNTIDFNLNYPTEDVDIDCSDFAYVSGISSSGDHDVDGGWNVLLSPAMDLSLNPSELHFWYWFKNDAPSGSEDSLIINLIAGTDTVNILKVHNQNTSQASTWLSESYDLSNSSLSLSNCRLMVMAGDFGADNLLEVGFDAFGVSELIIPGIQEINKEEFTIYPNPAQEQLNVNLKELKNVDSYEVMGIQGQKLMAGTVIGNVIEINISSLNEGMFILRLKSENDYLSQKFVKRDL